MTEGSSTIAFDLSQPENVLKDYFSEQMPGTATGPRTFSNLIQEVINQGRCTKCGGCVSFCTAVNYGALGLDAGGQPGYADPRQVGAVWTLGCD